MSFTRANNAFPALRAAGIRVEAPQGSETRQGSFTRSTESPTGLPWTPGPDLVADLLELLATIALEATASDDPLPLVGTIQLDERSDAGSGCSRAA
jgi:hypothetical protein